MKACEGMLVIATPASLEEIPSADVSGLEVHSCANDAAIPSGIVEAAKVLVVEVDPGLPQSVERLVKLCRLKPDLPKIAAIRNSTIPLVRTLIREGVSDVISLPFRVDEMIEVALGALAASGSAASGKPTAAPMIAVLQSVGGCGATTVATHLAACLAASLGKNSEIAIADFDLQSGTVADYMGCRGSGTIADLLAAGSRLDQDLVRSVACTGEFDVTVFAAPTTIEPVESVDTDQLLQLLSVMRQNYGGLIIDLPADITNWSLSAISASDLIVLVVELSVTSLRQAKRRLELFEAVGINPRRVEIVVNRVEKRMFKSIDLSDVTATLGKEIFASLAVDGKELNSAQTQGLLVQALNRRNSFYADTARLAESISARMPFRER